MDLYKTIALSQLICKTDINTLKQIWSKRNDFNPHPLISNSFGTSFIRAGEKNLAKEAIIEGATFGLKYPCEFYDNVIIDSVGQNLALLVTQFPVVNEEYALKATSLAYIYLSRCIELRTRLAFDSYRTRAILFKDNKSKYAINSLLLENLGAGVLIEPFIISDFYYSSQAPNSPHSKDFEFAQIIHSRLDDISISGKDADEFSLRQLAELGENRHKVLFNLLKIKYQSRLLNLSVQNLYEIC